MIIIIFFSIIISFPILFATHNGVINSLYKVLTGSAHSWYLYAILVIYLFAPLLSKFVYSFENKYIFILSLIIIIGVFVAKNLSIGQFEALFMSNGPYNWLFIFGVVLMGSVIKRAKNNFRIYLYSLMIILWISISTYYALNYKGPLTYIFIFSHASVSVMFGSIGIVGLVNEIKWTSKIVNWIVKHLYFIYEYHWIIYLLYGYIFRNELANQSTSHLYFYIAITTTIATLIPISFVITRVQIPFSKWLTPIMQNKWDKFYKKIYNPSKQTNE